MTRASLSRPPTVNDVASNLLLDNCPLTVSMVNSFFMMFGFLLSLPALFLPRNRLFLHLLILVIIASAIITLAIGLDIWFSTLETHKNLAPIWNSSSPVTQSILQFKFQCCGYSNPALFVEDQTCPTAKVAAQLGPRRDLPCAYLSATKDTKLAPLALLWPGQKSPAVLAEANSFTSDRDLAMLHHFVSNTSRNIFHPRAIYGTQEIDIMSLATSHVHIMHAVLAAAALHLRETTPSGKCYAELETNHWVSASQNFRTQLNLYGEATDPDPLVTTCMLLSLIAFANVPSADQALSTNRWPFTPTTPHSLQWLYVQLGLEPLLREHSQRTPGNSIWLPLFLATGSRELYDDRPGVADIPSAYVALFEITPSSICVAEANGLNGLITVAHPYLRLVRRILSLWKLYNEATGRDDHDLNSIKYAQFMQAVDAHVMSRLESKDPRTLLLYAMWMGIFCAVDSWWCRRRTVSECWAVTKWLDENHGQWLGPGVLRAFQILSWAIRPHVAGAADGPRTSHADIALLADIWQLEARDDGRTVLAGVVIAPLVLKALHKYLDVGKAVVVVGGR
ncbi:hypothetical protein DV737_g331, partial [Chaetothyriales sp. CBS 132003]